MHHIAVLNQVFFAFKTHQTFFLGARFTGGGNEIVVADHLRTNKALFKVCMYHTGCGRCFGIATNGPGTDFFFASGKIGNKAEQFITTLNHTVKP